MLQDQEETVDRRCAEVFTCQYNLAIGVFIDVLHKSVTTVQAAPAAFHEALNGSGCCASTATGSISFDLLIDVLKNGPDNPNAGDQEGTEHKTAHIVSEHPIVSSAY